MRVALQAVLFDLDGTLVDLDMDRFLPVYLDALGRFLSDRLPAETLVEAVLAATSAMIADVDPGVTNEQAFWREFARRTGFDLPSLREPLERFYRDVFPGLGAGARPVPGAPAAVAALRDQGLKLALATNPIFPRIAIEARLGWAGIPPGHFDLIADYETMHACKPQPAFFREICGKLGVAPQQALMVGNDPVIDIRGAARLGMATFLVEGGAHPGAFERRIGVEVLGEAAAVDPGAGGAATGDGRAPRRAGRGPLPALVEFVREFTNRPGLP